MLCWPSSVKATRKCLKVTNINCGYASVNQFRINNLTTVCVMFIFVFFIFFIFSWGDINLLELFDAVRHPGFLKMASRHLKFGLSEMTKSLFIRLQTKELQKYIPEINEFDISNGPAGVRAQAMDSYGSLVDDFVFDKGEGESALAKQVLHCRNAPSPGATSSLAIAKMIADKLEKEFDIKC